MDFLVTYGVLFLFALDVDAQKLLDQQANDEGKYRYAQTDGRHLQKTFFEFQAFCHGDVVVEYKNNQNHRYHHDDQGQGIILGRQHQVGENQQRHRDEVGDAGVDAGFKGVGTSFASGGQELRRGHG